MTELVRHLNGAHGGHWSEHGLGLGVATLIGTQPLVFTASGKGLNGMVDWLNFLLDSENATQVVVGAVATLLAALLLVLFKLPKRAYLAVCGRLGRRRGERNLKKFIGYSPRRHHAVLGILRAANREAVGFFENLRDGKEPTEQQQTLWKKTFTDALTGQQNFVDAEVTAAHHMRYRSVFEYSGQRFLYSRAYASMRVMGKNRPARWAYGLAALALPPILLLRTLRRAWPSVAHRGDLARSLPYQVLFVSAWALGEVVGAMAGPGGALERVR